MSATETTAQELAENICKVFYSNTVTILECKYTDRAATLIQQALDATAAETKKEERNYCNKIIRDFIHTFDKLPHSVEVCEIAAEAHQAALEEAIPHINIDDFLNLLNTFGVQLINKADLYTYFSGNKEALNKYQGDKP